MGISKRAKLWTSAGAAVLLSSAACSQNEPEDAPASPEPSTESAASSEPQSPPAPPPMTGDGEGDGEGGESGGEFGVDPEEARTNPVPYIEALDLIRAHYLAGKTAYASGDTTTAAELFVHPIGEVYVDMEPVFVERGVAPFRELMQKAGELAIQNAPVQEVDAAAEAVMTAVEGAEEKAPAMDFSEAELNAMLISEMIERAALQYKVVTDGAVGAAYLDGYGFFKAAERRAASSLEMIRTQNAALGSAIQAALERLAEAFPGATKPDPLTVDASELLAASSKVRLLL